VEEQLDEIWSAAQVAWPTIAIERAHFIRFLEQRAASATALAQLHANDLYLACACLEGNRAALQAFDALLDEVGNKLRHVAPSDDILQEAKQLLRQVVMPRADRPAPLGAYSGQGELGGWIRIALARELMRLGRRGAVESEAAGEDLAAIADHDDDPEIAYLKTHYQEEFKQSFAAAIVRLDAAERRALRYSISERMSIDDIAKLEAVHRATAARLLARARARLVDETRLLLRERLQVDATELQSILNLLERQVDVSVRRLLV
jgi:RNA polymerase sigma-70 factor (ECF subfamily)